MSLPASWLPILLLHASWLGAGLLLLGRLRGARDWPALLALPTACFAGALLHVLALHALVLVTGPAVPIRPLVWVVVGAGAVALPFGVLSWRRARAGRPAAPKLAIRRVDAVLALLALPPLLLIGLQLVGLPDVSYDSVAFWNLKGAWLFHDVRLDGPEFTDARRIHANPGYPLYRPMVSFEHYVVIGADDDHAVKPGYLLMLGAGLLLVYSLLRDAAGRTAALAALALLLWTPIMGAATIPGSPGTTYVDFPLGLQFAASLAWLLRALRTRSSADVAAAMLAVATAVLMKNEGAIWCALLVPLGTWALLLGWSRDTRGAGESDTETGVRAPWHALAWLALPVAVLLAWKHVAEGLVPHVYIRAPTAAQIMRLPEVAPRMFAAWRDSLLDVPRWGALGLVLVAGCCVGVLRQLLPARGRHASAPDAPPAPRRARLARALLALVLLGQFCAVLLGVMLLELQKGGLDNWMAHAWDRLILQLVPSALLLTVVLNVRSDGAAAAAVSMPVARDADATRLSA